MVNVLVASKSHTYAGILKDLEAVDPRVIVRDGTGLFVEELRQAGISDRAVALFEATLRRDAALGIDPGTEGRCLDSLLEEAEVIYATLRYPENLMSRAPRLRWLHIGGAGVEFVEPEVLDSGIMVTNSKGALAIPIAEHVMAFIFTLAKDITRLCQARLERCWERFETVELTGRTLGIVGMGAIGSHLARMAKGVGMKVIAARRSANRRERGVGPVDEVYPRGALHDMLAESDFVTLALPLTGETQNLISEPELRAMKPTACIINVSRGPIINESALIRALKEGQIAGAGLDVFDKEPLPTDDELWELPNVVLSPHMAGSTERRDYHVSELFCDNLRRYVAGRPLINVVTRDRGY
ncbi:MAG: D-2-hydroxyacid dehydrogenase [Chloroflexi bacterium]|nr:D-2-hydroxyacid dehydrogenase [Chloroflexota bacterium]